MLSVSGTMLRDLVLCERRLELDLHGDPSRRAATSPFVRMLWRDGLTHENEILASLRGPLVDLRDLPRADRESGTVEAIARNSPAVLGSVLKHQDLIGMPDVLQLTTDGYVALDVKAGSAFEGGNHTYKKTYLTQVAHYAHILGATSFGRADVAGIIDRNGIEVIYDLNLPLGRDRRSGAERHLELLVRARRIRDGAEHTTGALGAICGMCEWRDHCTEQLKIADDPTQLAGLGRSMREALAPLATTIKQLAAIDLDRAASVRLPGLGTDRILRFAERARLWHDPESGPIAYRPLGIPSNPHRIDFDVESDPIRNLVYLHGFWHDRPGFPGEFVHFFAPSNDEAGERQAFACAIDHFRAHRSAHWYHFSAYERTAYAALQRRHPSVCDADEIETIFARERCTDLYGVVAKHTDWPLGTYGLKSIAKACGFAWSDTDPGGAASIEWFDRYARTGDEALRDRIVNYNRDDVRASKVVRDALIELDATGGVVAFRSPNR